MANANREPTNIPRVVEDTGDKAVLATKKSTLTVTAKPGQVVTDADLSQAAKLQMAQDDIERILDK
ncbi:hypothetical protein A3K55_00310 [Candidatus Shapirobacteria bacterium RBG_13_44_7]|uniref:Uncharacterized protein n=1 Tax=Candidatus Shapirobacteria bacterium RBG_13_44_7 TaxID=1802149 RepID=A0A1F7SKQ4_9BACT|nr:MAG: hypothetical protein A3K55_00310 [Candidatus Shapirobacteria bacterium RBG_13_44_7]